MSNLDRALTHSLIANFKELGGRRRSAAAGDQALTTALLRLKGQALRLENQIRERERIGTALQKNLAQADRRRLRGVLRLLKDLSPQSGT